MTDEPSFDSQSLGRRLNELLVLSLLEREPMHGYQIAVEAEERSGGYFTFNHGTLYPILHRLEGDGLIAGQWSDPEEGRARKAYALTEAGRTYLEEGIRGWRGLERGLAPFFGGKATSAAGAIRGEGSPVRDGASTRTESSARGETRGETGDENGSSDEQISSGAA